jgi:glutaredoxin 3
MTNKVTIYTTSLCGYCHSAKALLRKKGVAFDEIDVSGDRKAREALVEKAAGRTTVPQIWIGETHVGGCDDLYALERQGRLDAMLAG